jgi:hypothetical protein
MAETKTTSKAKAEPAEAPETGPRFGAPGEEEPETITATFGEEGEDPNEVGFVGTVPKPAA